jgi:hypothetical protein
VDQQDRSGGQLLPLHVTRQTRQQRACQRTCASWSSCRSCSRGVTTSCCPNMSSKAAARLLHRRSLRTVARCSCTSRMLRTNIERSASTPSSTSCTGRQIGC